MKPRGTPGKAERGEQQEWHGRQDGQEHAHEAGQQRHETEANKDPPDPDGTMQLQFTHGNKKALKLFRATHSAIDLAIAFIWTVA